MNEKHNRRPVSRILALLLAVVMVTSLVATTAMAYQGDDTEPAPDSLEKQRSRERAEDHEQDPDGAMQHDRDRDCDPAQDPEIEMLSMEEAEQVGEQSREQKQDCEMEPQGEPEQAREQNREQTQNCEQDGVGEQEQNREQKQEQKQKGQA